MSAPFIRKSATSREAATRLESLLTDRQAQVLALYRGDALTDNELIARAVAAGMSANTPRARRVELVRAGLLEEAGEYTAPGARTPSMRWRVRRAPVDERQLDLPLLGVLPW